jgi:tRNA pseudouridine32 synthase/23S rRNA pseudouridine746 synthase
VDRLTYFEPQPAPAELPERMPSPFGHVVHPLARRAAALLDAELAASRASWGLEAPGGGKMFGVLVVAAPDRRIGFLRGFSGMLGGSWHVDGFVPPLFDQAARDAVWLAGEDELRELARRIDELGGGAEARVLRAALAAVTSQQQADATALRSTHAERRRRRHAERGRLVADDDPARRARVLETLAQQSRADTAEERLLDAAHREARAAPATAVAALDRERTALDQLRTARSRQLLAQIHDAYVVASGRGERRPLRALFEPEAPPGGAGDCAAPKLLAHAFRTGLRPLALAEVWHGAAPRTGGRHAGVFYPACRGKCGRVLGHMLDGLAVAPPPVFGADPVPDDAPRVIHADRWLVIVDKPCGLLSVPGRSGLLRDSVAARLRRLDLDTSGLLLVALDATTHAELQRQFARREIEKRYVAWLDGEVRGDRGEIELALRVDVDDRPRQIHDPVHGKPARTTWQVLARAGGRTRVAFHPHSGRTHQLRVHAAHPLGLDAPIVGDRLYGRGADADTSARLQLHAERLAFVHPATGERLTLELPAPF